MSDISKGGILSILRKRAGLRNWNSAGDLNFYQGLFQFPAGLLAISAHPWTKGPLILASISSIYELFLSSFLVALYSIFNWLVDVITTCLIFTTRQTEYARHMCGNSQTVFLRLFWRCSWRLILHGRLWNDRYRYYVLYQISKTQIQVQIQKVAPPVWKKTHLFGFLQTCVSFSTHLCIW